MNDVMEILLKHGKKHPSRVMEFQALVDGLFEEINRGNINVNYHPDFPHLALFKYSIDCVAGRNWNVFTLMSRGLILDLKNKVVVASPFMKFFNFGEIESGSASIIESEFTVTEKMDGSLGIMFYYEGAWRVATCGSFTSEQAKWAEEWIISNHVVLRSAWKKNTYLFEIIYPENKIVVNYNFSGLVLLAIFDPQGVEYSYEDLQVEASKKLRVAFVPKHDFDDMTSIVEKAETLTQNEEGYVIRFESGVRIKVKGAEYVRIHKLISKVTPLAIWDLLLNGDDLDEVKKELPEELEKDFDTIVWILSQKLESFVSEVEDMYDLTEHMSDKELGLYLAQRPQPFGKRKFNESIKYIFLMRKNKFHAALDDFSSLSRRKMFTAFRPKANVLLGYLPSSAATRFADDL